jgi:tetratricopeptide (TPR) repeat protein
LTGDFSVPRFDRLEFEQPADRPDDSSARRPDPDRDEHYWLSKADKERRRGMYEEALRHYSRVLEHDRSLVGGWVGQVQMLIALEEYPEADMWSRKALDLFRNNSELLAARSQAVCRMGNLALAFPLCDACLAQPGHSSFRWLVRGELMVADKQELDRYCFDKAEQIDSDWLVPLEAALIYLHYALPAKALLRVRRTLEKAPDSPHAWYVRGQCEDEMGLIRPAMQSLERCLELVPRHAEAQRRLVRIRNQGISPKRLLRRLLSLFGRTAGLYPAAKLGGRALKTYELANRVRELT